jgi:hypothetical protein
MEQPSSEETIAYLVGGIDTVYPDNTPSQLLPDPVQVSWELTNPAGRLFGIAAPTR